MKGAGRFRWWVLGITAAGLVPRVLVAKAFGRALVGDSLWYRGVAGAVSRGDGFVEPLALAVGARVPTATHPPLYALYLAALDRVGVDGVVALRVASALAGVAVVPLIAWFARELAGPRAGIGAAVVAALYPLFWMNDAGLLSESLLAPITAATLLATLAFRATPDVRRGAALGGLLGLMVLTRSEALALVPLLPLLGARRALRRAWWGLLAALAAAALVTAPWIAYNLARFEQPVLLTGNLGGTLAGASCDSVWYGARTGWWGCETATTASDEGVRDRELRAAAARYWRAHTARAPLVVAARVGRLWGLYAPRQTAELDAFERDARAVAPWLLVGYGIAVVLAAVGVIALHRERTFVAWWWALAGTATLTAAAFYGSWRFRVPADVGLAALAGVGLARLSARLSVSSRLRGAARAQRAAPAGGPPVEPTI